MSHLFSDPTFSIGLGPSPPIFNSDQPLPFSPFSLESFKACGDDMQAASSDPDYNRKVCPHKLRLYDMIQTLLLADINPTAFLKPLFEANENGKPVKIDWLWTHFGNAYIMDRPWQEWQDAYDAGNGDYILFDYKNGDEGLSDTVDEDDEDDEDDDDDDYLHNFDSESGYDESGSDSDSDSDDELGTGEDSDGESMDCDDADYNPEPEYVNSGSVVDHVEPLIECTFPGPFSEVPFSPEESDDESGAYNDDFGTASDHGFDIGTLIPFLTGPVPPDILEIISPGPELVEIVQELYDELVDAGTFGQQGELQGALQAALTGPNPTQGILALLTGPHATLLVSLLAAYCTIFQHAGDAFMNDGDDDLSFAGRCRGLLSHDAAIAFVNGLQQVELSTLPETDRKCPFCWGRYGEDEDGKPIVADDNAPTTVNPVRTACGHVFHRDCLVEVVEKSSKNCPMCSIELHSGRAPV